MPDSPQAARASSHGSERGRKTPGSTMPRTSGFLTITRRAYPRAARRRASASWRRPRVGSTDGMRFRPGARLNAGQVQDRRGARGGVAVGGGIGTLLVVVLLAVLGVDVPGGSDPYSL